MRRSVGLSSAMTMVAITQPLLTPDQPANGVHELLLVELMLQQVRTRAGFETRASIRLVTATRHDDDGNLLPSARSSDGPGQGESIHAGHFDVGEHEIGRLVAQSRGAVQAVHASGHFETGALEDRSLELAHTYGVLDDEDARLAPGRRLLALRRYDDPGSGQRRTGGPHSELA